jgi:hypothetical protein
MKILLILVLLGLFTAIGFIFIKYAPVCTVDYACPVTRDLRGRVMEAECSPEAKEYQNSYQARIFGATIVREGVCRESDMIIR